MSSSLLAVDAASKNQLREMLSAYLNELGQYSEVDLSYKYFDSYWLDCNRWPFFIEKENETVGFVLLNTWSPSQKGTDYAIAEFCVLPEFRGSGIGKSAVTKLLHSRPGLWEISVVLRNKTAKAFWTSALKIPGVFELEQIDFEDRLVFRFSNEP